MNNKDILEQNVESLLEGRDDVPRMTDIARAKIRAQLIAAHAVTTPKRSP